LVARYFEEESTRMGAWAFSSGNPPETWHAAIVRCCKALKERNAGHVMTGHQYGGVNHPVNTLRDTEPFHALRHRELYRRLRADDAVIPLIISEAGQNAGYEFIGTWPFIEDFAWFDAKLMEEEDRDVIGCCAWTLGNYFGPEGRNANFQEALPALAEHFITHPNPTPPGPLPHRTYLPAIMRQVEEPADAAGLVALGVGAAATGGAWLLNRRMRARRKHA
jgi:hypothetical protein